MGDKLRITLRTATRDRQASISAPADATVAEVLESAKTNWRLAEEYEYIVRCERTGVQLRPEETLIASGVRAEDVLEIQPLADAGCPDVIGEC